MNRLVSAVVLVAATGSLRAGSFTTDFNSGLPPGTTTYGNALVVGSGGFTNSGFMQLTAAAAQTNGSFIITTDLDSGTPVVSFTASFKALVGGGTAADGFSFNFAPDLPAGTFGEAGAGTGLTVSFDTFDNGSPDYVGIGVSVGGSEVAQFPFSGLRANTFVDVVIQLHPDSTLDVIYDGTHVFTNLYTGFVPAAGSKFGFGARTGGQYDNHWLDDLSITTQTAATAYLDYYFPIGRAVRADTPVNIVLTDYTTAIKASTIVLKVDGSTVTPTITPASPNTTVSFQPPALFASGSSHSVSIAFADDATPTPKTTTWEWSFTVANYGTLDTNLAANASFVNLNSPGFFIRYSQIADPGSRDVARAELQLADLLIDSSTGLPYVNLAEPNPVDSTFTYFETNSINYSFPAGGGGSIPNDAGVPGMPGPTTGTGTSYALEAVTYLHLTPGLYNLGVNSSDGFKLVVADGADVFAPQQAIFPGVRGAGDTTTSFAVALAGYYPFRLVYFTGDPAYGPAPGTASPSVEFFNLGPNGEKTLVNDTSVPGYVPAFMAAKTKPHVRSVEPDIGETAVPGNTPIIVTVVDGSLTVQTASVGLLVNGATVSPSHSTAGSAHIFSYQPPTVFAPNSTNVISFAFTDSSGTRRTNTWSFVVENILTQVWRIPPGSTDATWAKWVTSGSTERGLAFNPKSGHVLLVSRSAATGADGPSGVGVAVLDGNTGAYLKQLSLALPDGATIPTGPGLFKLNLVDVADDGAIYACNLTTDSSLNNFAVYRWSDENASPTIAYTDNPAGAGFRMRVGDTFRVRNSGAGTQVIASQNNPLASLDIGGGTNVVLLTTADGTNFTSIRLPVPGIAGGDLRLGLAFGCGDTLYGATTASGNSRMRYAGFDAKSGVTTLLATYLLNNPTLATVGPLGVDIPNQRVIGNATSQTAGEAHSMNLYDLARLVSSPATNFILDRKVFGTANTSFGTGAIDFTPDGTRLFTLDTANGIVAFGLASKLAAPSICADPRTNLVAGPGALGFMAVEASGAPLSYQWRFNGTPLANATNRTLDIYDVQAAKLGFYSVVVSNAMGSQTSKVAVLDTQMIFTESPADQIIAPNGSATLTAGVSNGLPPYSFQWKLNGANVGANSSAYPITNAQAANAGGYTITVTDSLGQSVTSPVAVVTVGTLGTGTGLTADYYSDQFRTFTNAPTLTRVDPTVDFDWLTNSPDASISVDYFTARWSGQVQPFYSQPYTFTTRSDDGIRLWIDGQLVIDSWINQAPTEHSGTIGPLVANQKYDLLLEYYENTGGAVAQLSWSSANQPKQIIPQTQLYAATGTYPAKLSAATRADGAQIIAWPGSDTYTLQAATNLTTSPWEDIAGATSPYTNAPASGAERYFRLIKR